MRKVNSSKKLIRFRCWVDIDGRKFFGPGRAELLQMIEETGSIAKAAQSMGMSYKKAWAAVNEMNSKAKKPYVIVQKVGEKGGGAHLTDTGSRVVKTFNKLTRRIHSIVEKEKDLLRFI